MRLSSPAIVNIADLRNLARRRLPRVVFDYLDGTADDGITGRDNLAAFSDLTLSPHYGVACAPDLSTKLLGVDMAMPVFLSPIGYCRLLHPQGDLGAARAAKAAHLPFIQATGSGYALEDVARQSGPLFFQVYKMGGRPSVERALARAKAVGCKGIFVTIDTPVGGNRELDARNGMAPLMGARIFPKLRYVPDILMHPNWLIPFLLDGGVPPMMNVTDDAGRPLDAPDAAQFLGQAHICWSDLAWIRRAWDGPMVVKGIMRADDARRALEEGADGIVISNHGGRQLDTVAGTLRVLPGIAEEIKGRLTILIDGGIRRGGDIAKAICLGADGALIGRAYGYGLAAAGEKGVTRALEILRADFRRTMALLGANTLQELTRDLVAFKDGFRVD